MCVVLCLSMTNLMALYVSFYSSSSQHELVAMSHDGLGEIQSAGSGVDRLTHRSSEWS